MSNEKSPSFTPETTPGTAQGFNATNYIFNSPVQEFLGNHNADEMTLYLVPTNYPYLYFHYNNAVARVSLQFSECSTSLNFQNNSMPKAVHTQYLYTEPMKNILTNLASDLYINLGCESDTLNCITNSVDRENQNSPTINYILNTTNKPYEYRWPSGPAIGSELKGARDAKSMADLMKAMKENVYIPIYSYNNCKQAYFKLSVVSNGTSITELTPFVQSIETSLQNPKLQEHISGWSQGTMSFAKSETPSSPLAAISPSNVTTPSPEVLSSSVQASSPSSAPSPINSPYYTPSSTTQIPSPLEAVSSSYVTTPSPEVVSTSVQVIPPANIPSLINSTSYALSPTSYSTTSSTIEAEKSPSNLFPVPASTPSNGSFPFQASEPKSPSGLSITDITLISAGVSIFTAGLVIGLVKARQIDRDHFDGRGAAWFSNKVATASDTWNSAKDAVNNWLGRNPEVYQNANPETNLTFVEKVGGRSRSSSNEGFTQLVRESSESSSSAELEEIVIGK
ncbi:MAG: hypothetical protein K0R98_890 [Rickettsiaceae bacterium]|jgi:hypothetical protein|nr:hypothetical protein [Rickettsiaceae bacterium]